MMNETDNNQYEIIALKKNMKSNMNYQEKVKYGLENNLKEKKELQNKLVAYMDKCFNVHDLQDICRTFA